MLKKLLISFLVLIGLMAASVFVVYKARPHTKNANPLADIDEKTISKIWLESTTGNFTFEKQANGEWMVTDPARDLLDDTTLEPMTSVLKQADIGSIISENKNYFSKYGVEPPSAAHLKIFLSSNAVPTLDGYIGNQGPNYTDSYFRFEGKDAVYLVGNLPAFLPRQPLESYRLKRLFKPDMNNATAISIGAGKTAVAIEKSSDTWKNAKTHEIVNIAWVEQLREKIKGVVVSSFMANLPSEQLKLDSSALTLTVTWPEGPKTAVLGKAIYPPQPGTYARVDDRSIILTVQPDAVKGLLDFIKKPPPKA